MNRPGATRDYVFHPFEIAFCGYSNSGKTTLIEKIVAKWSHRGLLVSYLKHDAHRFEMDHPGKDTMRIRNQGAFQVTIQNEHQGALIQRNPRLEDLSQVFLDGDVLLIEGYKKLPIPKIVVLDQNLEILTSFADDGDHQILGYVGPWTTPPSVELCDPYFHRDDLEGIDRLIQAFWERKKAQRPLYGLILAGGLSQRMGQDKGLLRYHPQTTQLERCLDLLSPFCVQSFVSVRADQADAPAYRSYPLIVDRYVGFGPMGGILSAFQQNPMAAYLVLAIDLPGIRQETLSHLVAQRDEKRFATCFVSGEKKFKEPLCTIYEPKAFPKMLQELGLGGGSPSAFLRRVCTKDLVSGVKEEDLLNINTPEEREVFIRERTFSERF